MSNGWFECSGCYKGVRSKQVSTCEKCHEPFCEKCITHIGIYDTIMEKYFYFCETCEKTIPNIDEIIRDKYYNLIRIYGVKDLGRYHNEVNHKLKMNTEFHTHLDNILFKFTNRLEFLNASYYINNKDEGCILYCK